MHRQSLVALLPLHLADGGGGRLSGIPIVCRLPRGGIEGIVGTGGIVGIENCSCFTMSWCRTLPQKLDVSNAMIVAFLQIVDWVTGQWVVGSG